MPFVRVRHKSGMQKRDLEQVVGNLPHNVADALGCEDPGGSLMARDVEVAVEEFGPLDISGTYDLQVMVDASDFPSRQANLSQRTQQIADRLTTILGGSSMKFYVWVRLTPAAFIEGKST